MNSVARTALGIAAIVPGIGLVSMPFVPDGTFIPLGVLVTVLGWMTVAVFIRHAWCSGDVTAEKRGLWTALLVFANVVVLPFFWFWYVRSGSRR